jgi:diphthine methyl ester synthase
MLYLIGLGLGDENDVTIKGANAIRSCSKVFLEMYTSVLGVDVEKLVCVQHCAIVFGGV